MSNCTLRRNTSSKQNWHKTVTKWTFSAKGISAVGQQYHGSHRERYANVDSPTSFCTQKWTSHWPLSVTNLSVLATTNWSFYPSIFENKMHSGGQSNRQHKLDNKIFVKVYKLWTEQSPVCGGRGRGGRCPVCNVQRWTSSHEDLVIVHVIRLHWKHTPHVICLVPAKKEHFPNSLHQMSRLRGWGILSLIEVSNSEPQPHRQDTWHRLLSHQK